jgi:HAD superfamily hydrolase (TIGR01509 family)
MLRHSSQTTTEEEPRAWDGRWKALIFDLDGTLYDQAAVRRAMLRRLLSAHLTSPVRGFLALRALRSYRAAQEELRKTHHVSGDIASAQVQLAAEKVGISMDSMETLVARWMEQEPLPFVASSIRKGALELLQAAKTHGLRLAVCSDYPAERKLMAMGITQYFDVVVTAQHPQVERFKPDPKGLELTLAKLSVRKDEAVYIGDRADVDAVAAARAGIQGYILSRRQDFAQLLELMARDSQTSPYRSGVATGERP